MGSFCTSTSASSTGVTTNGLSSWASPYVNSLLTSSQSLANQPYQAYKGAQNADMTALQNQSFNAAANLGIAPQTTAATGAAQSATNNLLNTSYNPMQAGYQSVGTQNFNTPGAVQSYMNPYVLASLNPQMQLLAQQQGQQQAQNQAQATQAGAFGGSRMGVQNALQNQSNQLAMSNLVGQGYNTAYNNAQQAFTSDQARQLQAQQANQAAGLTAQQANINQQQFGDGLGLQANQSALTGANALGMLGQNQAAQQAANIGVQNTLGQQQQAYQQGLLNTQYQNYVNQLNYPYQQAGFMQNMLSGLPMSTSTTQMYQGAPTAAQSISALGMGALGLGSLLAEGGVTKSYKKGGAVKRYADAGLTSSITGLLPTNNSDIIQRAIMDAQSRGDTETAMALQQELGSNNYISNQSRNLNVGLAQPTARAVTAGAPQAGSYGVNPAAAISAHGKMSTNMGAGAGAGPNMNAPTQDRTGMTDLKSALEMKKIASDVRKGRATQSAIDPQLAEQQLAEQQAVQDSVEAMNVPRSAQGGLQYIPVSDDVMPTVSAKRGGIMDVARHADPDGPDGSVTNSAIYSPGDAALYKQFGDKLLQSATDISNFRPTPALTPEQQAMAEQAAYQKYSNLAGPSPYAGMRHDISGLMEDNASNAKLAFANAMFQGAGKMVEGNNFARAAGSSIAGAGQAYTQGMQAVNQEKRALASMNINLSDAERKEKLGLTKDAISDVQQAQKNAGDVDKLRLQALKDQGEIYGKGATAFKPQRPTGSGSSGPKLNEIAFLANYENLKQTMKPNEGESLTAFDARIKSIAANSTLNLAHTSDVGANRQTIALQTTLANENNKVQDGMKGFEYTPAYMEAQAAGDTAKAQSLWNARVNELRAIHGGPGTAQTSAKGAPAAPTAAPTAAPAPTRSLPTPPPGTKLGINTPQGYQVVDSNGKIIGFMQPK